jgi:hypothetical protein
MRELIQEASFWGILLCGVLSLLPFRFQWKWRSWNLYLPVAAVVLYAAFEVALPVEVDVLVGLMVLLPLLLFICLNGMAKVGLLVVLMKRARLNRRHLRSMPQRSWQFLCALPILAGCSFWFWMMWK